MPRRSSVPSYRLHKQSGQAVVTLADGHGSLRDVLLGKHGTPESRAEYLRVLAEWESACAQQIADQLEYKNNSHFRSRLSQLVKAGHLRRDKTGYRM